MQKMISRQEKMFFASCIERLERGSATNFLDPRKVLILSQICKNKNISYHLFQPFVEAEKVVLYTTDPTIVCMKVTAKESVTHSQVLGTLFSHQIEPEMYGDIVVMDNVVYLWIVRSCLRYFEQYFTHIGKFPVQIEQSPTDVIADYEPKKISETYLTSSLRLDAVVAAITGLSRKKVLVFFEQQYIMYQYQEVNKGTLEMEEGAVFSIRKYGKYQLQSIVGKSKKGKYILEVAKYQ